MADSAAAQNRPRPDPDRYRPGVTVLLDDQISLIRNQNIVLIADSAARDERGRRTVELFRSDRRVRAARIVVADVIAPTSGGIGAALDAVRKPVAVVVLDILDDGWRRGTAPQVVLDALRAAAERRLMLVVLDRPNPITGDHAEGPVLDSIAAASDGLYGLPARHGMTVGELAQYFNTVARLGAGLTVVPVRGWRRSWWPGEHDIPDNPGGVSAAPERLLLTGALAPFTATNLTVTPGPGRAEAELSAPWLDARRVANALADRLMPGLKFSESRGRIRIQLTDRDRASTARLTGALLAAVFVAHRDSLRIDGARFDTLAASPTLRASLLTGEDGDALVDRELRLLVDFSRRARIALIYR